MYIRTKTFINKNGTTRTYVYLVKGERINGKVRQKVIANLGRLEEFKEKYADKLAEGLVKFSKEQWIKTNALNLNAKWAKEFGPALIFRRLWEQLNLHTILQKVLSKRKINTNVEEAIFAMVLNRLTNPTSKVGVNKWKDTVYRPEFKKIKLHHFYRALDILAEYKDKIERELFTNIKNLLNLKLDLVFWDTTSTYFEGKGAEQLCKYGFSKDHRPDRVQVMLGILMTQEGIPIGHQVFPGNTADVKTFKKIIKELVTKFNIRRVILVADRGMVSKEVLNEITKLGLEYILGAKMRKIKETQEVLTRGGRFKKIKENLMVKEVKYNSKRYIVCFNPEEAKRDKVNRENIIQKLQEKIHAGNTKALIGNTGYKRYLKINKQAITINIKALKQEAKYDGKYVLITNTNLSTQEAAQAYRELWKIERAFREIKSVLELRPVYHWTENRIRGHIMICFLAFLLETVLVQKLKQIGYKGSYSKILLDITKLKVVKVNVQGVKYLVRTELAGDAFEAFKALKLQVPKTML